MTGSLNTDTHLQLK